MRVSPLTPGAAQLEPNRLAFEVRCRHDVCERREITRRLRPVGSHAHGLPRLEDYKAAMHRRHVGTWLMVLASVTLVWETCSAHAKL